MGIADVTNTLNTHKQIPVDKKANILNNGGSGSGKYYFPDNELSTNLFDQIASNYHRNGFNFFLIEVKTVYFNMFVDFDFAGKMDGEITLNFIQRLHDIVHEVFTDYFPVNDWNWTTCPNSGYEHKGIVVSKNKINPNLHFNFPHVQMDIHLAKKIVYKMMEKLYFMVEGDWHSFVDVGMYKCEEKTGLRILGCPKYKNGQRLDEGYRLLKLRNVLIGEEEFEEEEGEDGEVEVMRRVQAEDYIEQITLEHLELCSIRNASCTKGTPHRPVENTMVMATVKQTDQSALVRIQNTITHRHMFAKQINHNTFIFRNIGTRKCMVGPDFPVHSSNNFFVKKQANGEYRYYCLSDRCQGRYRVLFKDVVEEDFDPKKLNKIAKAYEEYETASDMNLELLNYLNLFFAYIEDLDTFVQISKEGFVLYKNMGSRLQYAIPTVHSKTGTVSARNLFCSSVYRKEYKKLIFLPYLIKGEGDEEKRDAEVEELDSEDEDPLEEELDSEDESNSIAAAATRRMKKRRRIVDSDDDDDDDDDEEDQNGMDIDSEEEEDSDDDSSDSDSEEEQQQVSHLKPLRSNPRHLNMFNGFLHKYDPDFEADFSKIKPICKHLFKVWCRENEELYNYLMGFLACIIRYPASHPAIAVVVHSEQGAGKGCITTFLREFVIGSKWASSCSEMEQLTGKFTAILLNKLMITCDEINNFGGGYKKNNRMKNLISEKTQSVEKKNHDPFDVDVFCRFMFLSNNQRVVKVEAGCRRYFCLHAVNAEQDKRSYFKRLHTFLTSMDAGLHFFHYLANWNKKWDSFKIPMTCYRQYLMRKELPTGPLFLFDQLVGDRLEEQVVSSATLFNNYENAWCPAHLDMNEGGRTFKKEKKKEFEEHIIAVFKFHSLLNPADDHDFDIWYEMENDHSGFVASQNCIFNIPLEQYPMMIQRFRTTFGFWEPVDQEVV
jgi:hypothetical protein